MPKSLLRSTTAATLSLSIALMQPVGSFAQEADIVLLCEDGNKQPCADGVRLLDEAETKALRKARRAAEAEAAAAEAAATAAAEAAAADQAAAEKAAEEAAAADQAAADKAAADAAAADAAAADQAAAEKAATAAQDAADAAAEQAADAAAAEQAAADQAAADAAAMEAEPAAEPDTAIEPVPATEPEPATDPDAMTDPDTTAEPAVDPDTAVTPDEPLPELPSGETTVEDIGAEPLPTPVEALPPVDAPLPEALAGAIAGATGDAEAVAGAEEAVTTTVTADDVRTSDQDFENAVSATAAPKAKDKGLTDLEKFGLVALGAVAIGAIINSNRVVANSGDRVVVQRDDGQYVVLKDDDTLLRQPGSTIQTQNFADGSTLTTMNRPDGSKIITIRDAEGRVLRRALQHPDGTQTLLIDDTKPVKQVDVSTLPRPRQFAADANDRDALAAALASLDPDRTAQRFSLRQIRDIREVRELAPQIDLNAITFASGSAAVKPDQAAKLSALGRAMTALIDQNPGEIFLIEGHTDAVGKAAYNLALSDRRAESVALVLTEYFGVPPENLVVQGYGEAYLKIRTLADEQLNRRVAVRRITDLMRVAAN